MSSECDCSARQPDGSCGVLNEFRALRAPNGARVAMESYMAEMKRRQEETPREVNLRMHKLGVPGDIVGDSAKPGDTSALQGARRFLSSDPQLAPFLLLLGPVGVGKTVAAACVLRDFVQRHEWNSAPTGVTQQPCMWVDARELTGIREFRDEHQSWLKSIQGTLLLILDDAGHEATEAGKNALTDVLLSRLARNRRTVLTANLTFEDLVARYGQAVGDRLKAKAMVRELPGKSLRQRPQARRMP